MRPQGIEKRQAVRKSVCLEAIQQSRSQFILLSSLGQEARDLSIPSTNHLPADGKAPKCTQILHKPSGLQRKRKREHSVEDTFPTNRDQSYLKRLQTSPSSRTVEKTAISHNSEKIVDPLTYWIHTRKWHKQWFEQDSQVREDFKRDCGLKESEEQDRVWKPVESIQNMDNLCYLLPKRKSSSSLRRKNSESSTQTPSDQLPREAKSAPHKNSNYSRIFETKGSYMIKWVLGITDESNAFNRTLLVSKQTIPQDSLFRDDLFDDTCQSVQDRNEAMVVRDISPLICPSAQVLRIYGSLHLKCLTETVNEGWNSAIPFYGPRPQPDYSVGFGRPAFTDNQLQRLEPFVGEILYKSDLTSYFMATSQMYFPFLTCEVKCGTTALDIADRQNIHSMTLAVRGIVELFRMVKREKELHQEILAFSISHDHCSVRIYGHYPVIEGNKTSFYRHPIRMFDFTEQEGKEKWTAYKFTRNIYDVWMPLHLKRICTAIDDLPPDVNFDLSVANSVAPSERQSSQQSNVDDAWIPEGGDSQSSLASAQDVTPTTSFTIHERVSKKLKNQ
ncbi:hypothetical protein MMC27_003064 [Xylographa pallens]|nr:hypothetical protein [Xylographa pallens]